MDHPGKAIIQNKMKLLLRTEAGESVEFDVLPSDTFTDLSQRLLELGKVEVNLKQLSSKGRPFDMTANVMEYFNVSSTLINKSSKQDETLSVDNEGNDSKGDNGISDQLKSNVNDNDNSIKSASEVIEEICEPSNDFSQELLPLSSELIDNNASAHSVEEISSIETMESSREKLICRLCAQVTDYNTAKYLFENSPCGDNVTFADKINFSLPIYVSEEDDLPKHMCYECLSKLETSYEFAKMVKHADEMLEEMDFHDFSNDRKCYDCPFCDGHMTCVDNSDPKESDTNFKTNVDDVQGFGTDVDNKNGEVQVLKFPVDELIEDSLNYENMKEHCGNIYQEQSNDSYKTLSEPNSGGNFPVEIRRKRGRPKKYVDRLLQPTTLTNNYNKAWPAKDKLTPVRKRGRPKGSKNKPLKSKVTEVECLICDQTFSDIPSLLAHALLCHCEDGSNALPCPLCNSVWPDEGELVHHVNNHSTTYQIIINSCALCSNVYKEKSELEQHLFDGHIKQKAIRPTFLCQVCDEHFSSTMGLAIHLADNHSFESISDIWKCLYCQLSFSVREEFMHHYLTVHRPASDMKYSCPKCDEELTCDKPKELIKHLIESHCTELMIERPLLYKCPACKSRFKNQYNLIKHPCTGVGNKLNCDECELVFPIKARYVLHLQFHNENHNQAFEMRCDVCLAEFDEEDNFYNHIRFHHETDKKIECSKCNKNFKNFSSLTMHMRRHEEIRKHKCEICEKTFLNAQTLREHSVSHMTVKPYQCQICGQCLSRPSRLRLHLRSHSVQRSINSMLCYTCSKCSQVFPNSEQAKHHCKQHQDESTQAEITEILVRQVLRCEYCDACYVTHDDINKHRFTLHKSDPANAYTCSICGAKFSSYARVATHKLTHGITTETLILANEDEGNQQGNTHKSTQFTVPQYFVCELCNKECLHYTYLNMHRKLCHPQCSPSHTCKDCNQLFPTAWGLHYHRRKMHNFRSKFRKIKKRLNSEDEDLTMYECPHCLRQYASPETLDLHMKRLHVRNSKQYAGYVCETCGKTFAFKGSWQSHCDAHNGIKRFHCKDKDCDKRFTHRAGLNKHMKLHSTDRPFLCEYCGKKFRDRTERDNHIRSHTGERPFMCDICGRTFHTRAVWLDHSRIHLDIRPHRCDKCGQSFRRSFALKSHYLIHTGERPFECKICGKDFRLKQSLSTHMKKDHEFQTDSAQENIIGRNFDMNKELKNNLNMEIDKYEESVIQEAQIIEIKDEMIDFQNYGQFITKSIINKDISKSELIAVYEPPEILVDQEVNVDGVSDTEQEISSLSTTSKLDYTETSEEIGHPELINCSEINDKISLKETTAIPIVYYEEPTGSPKKRIEVDTTQTLSNLELPTMLEFCDMMSESTESKES